MKNLVILAVLVLVLFSINLSASVGKEYGTFKVTQFPFNVYTDAPSRLNLAILSGWMGDIRNLKIDKLCTKNPNSGKSSMRVSYQVITKTENKAVGVYMQQNPASRLATLRGGYDLTKASKISFYARGENGNEVVEFKMVTAKEQNLLASSKVSRKITLTKEWKKYELDLSNTEYKDISGGLGFVIHTRDNREGVIFYLDDIAYTRDADRMTEAKVTAENNKVN
ncbi:MAG: hypothetical protein PHF84_02000 [bacterium]|nr:hypothetical protein [bacterium]